MAAAMRVTILLLVVAACGRSKFEPSSDASNDAQLADGEDITDAPCTLGSFAAPVQLPGPVNSIVDDWAPSISASDLTLVFYSQRLSSPGEPDIWWAKRSSAIDAFAPATVITEASSSSRDESPHLTADELELWFVSDRGGGGTMLDIYAASRASTALSFGAPTKITALSSAFDEDTVWISGDGLRVMFSSNRGSSSDLYVASRVDRAGAWSSPTIVSELSSLGVEVSPAPSADELEVLFVSNRPGGVGKYDVWRATRTDRDAPFTTPINVPQVSSTEDDWGLSLSADGQHLYYSYSASLAGGNADIWVASRPCE